MTFFFFFFRRVALIFSSCYKEVLTSPVVFNRFLQFKPSQPSCCVVVLFFGTEGWLVVVRKKGSLLKRQNHTHTHLGADSIFPFSIFFWMISLPVHKEAVITLESFILLFFDSVLISLLGSLFICTFRRRFISFTAAVTPRVFAYFFTCDHLYFHWRTSPNRKESERMQIKIDDRKEVAHR